mmetsp:Transcript_60860/g.188722  ORF Transcript_60860/g.188722 Transcript_60860/m.188722 type:complete len:534 (-) Transcript_60860:368-1969(-)
MEGRRMPLLLPRPWSMAGPLVSSFGLEPAPLPSPQLSWSPATLACPVAAGCADGRARPRACGLGLPKRGPPTMEGRPLAPAASTCWSLVLAVATRCGEGEQRCGEAWRGGAAQARPWGEGGSPPGEPWRAGRTSFWGECCLWWKASCWGESCLCRGASERRPNVVRRGGGGCDLAPSRMGLWPETPASGGVGTLSAGMLAEFVELLSDGSSELVPPFSVPAEGSSEWISSESQACPRASCTVARSRTSGTTRMRRKSQTMGDMQEGHPSSGKGQRSLISVRSRMVFTFVAWWGLVALTPVAPGPRYVVSSWRPVRSCSIVMPALQMSTASVWMSWPAKTSGAMYWSVPARLRGAEASSAHQPKSPILSEPSPVQSKFSGLMSRCRMPSWWRSQSPSNSCPAQCLPSDSPRRPVDWQVANLRRSHTHSSIRMYTWSHSSVTSQKRRMCRQLPASAQRLMASISESTCASMPRTMKLGRLMTLMAKAWPVARSTTRAIFAKAPPPRNGSSGFSSKSRSHTSGRDLSGPNLGCWWR